MSDYYWFSVYAIVDHLSTDYSYTDYSRVDSSPFDHFMIFDIVPDDSHDDCPQCYQFLEDYSLPH
jgi:hypothetical protein